MISQNKSPASGELKFRVRLRNVCIKHIKPPCEISSFWHAFTSSSKYQVIVHYSTKLLCTCFKCSIVVPIGSVKIQRKKEPFISCILQQSGPLAYWHYSWWHFHLLTTVDLCLLLASAVTNESPSTISGDILSTIPNNITRIIYTPSNRF